MFTKLNSTLFSSDVSLSVKSIIITRFCHKLSAHRSSHEASAKCLTGLFHGDLW